MHDHDLDHDHFFASFPRFLDSSETGPWLERLNARYLACIHANRELLAGARVLDLASHDGRFAFAALQNGAAHVVGIDVKERLVRAAGEHFEAYGVAPDRYRFLLGDMFDCMDREGPFDVVLCFGILYHITDHMRLFTDIAALDPRAIVVDTNLSPMEGSVLEVRRPISAGPPPPGSQLECHPSKTALEAMLSSFGWTYDYFDWPGSGLTEWPHMRDYKVEQRVTVTVTCPEHAVAPDVRRRAVETVLEEQSDDDPQFITVTTVAAKFDLTPQALRTWVRQTERARWREAGFTASRDRA